MRKILTLFVLLCIAEISWAQTTTPILKPSQLVANKKEIGTKFEKVTLFKAKSPEPEITKIVQNEQIKDYSILDLQTNVQRSISKKNPQALEIKIPYIENIPIELELAEVDIFGHDFAVKTASSITPVEVNHGRYYRGVIKGEKNGFASLSVFEGEIRGLISSPKLGNLVLGKIENANDPSAYILYNDRDKIASQPFYCDTPDGDLSYDMQQLSPPTSSAAVRCTGIYFEVDNDIFQNKGSTNNTVNYVTGFFNEVATLYANEDIKIVISEIFVWDTKSPYSGSSSSRLLTQFQNERTSFNGDLAQLLSFQASGGIAVLSGLCHPYNAAKMSFASIGTNYSSVPNFSWTVMVVSHELGHLFGSHHTHACVWNGNNTALDGCAGSTEGSCSNPGIPSGGGTIMSYCHLTQAGINLSLGFGTQPGNVIRNKVAAANCLPTCDDGTGGGGTGGGSGGGTGGGSGGGSACTENEVTLSLVLDNYPEETSWRILGASGQQLHAGGPYDKNSRGSQITETFCLSDDCISFEINDSYGDGICCAYGQGSYQLVDADGNNIASGGNFGFNESKNICFDGAGGGGGGQGSCLTINFNDYTINSYGGGQDIGSYEIRNSGATLKIQNNAWKSIALNYEVTANTVIEFDFASTLQGEIHSIGFDNNNSISASKSFKVHGIQNWGILNYDNYPGGNSWQPYKIPIGQFYTGTFDRLFFVADHDGSPRNGNSYFRNIKIYEGLACASLPRSGTITRNRIQADIPQLDNCSQSRIL